MTDTNTTRETGRETGDRKTQKLRDFAAKEVATRERAGQSPVPPHALLFAIRGEARRNDNKGATTDDVKVALLTGDTDPIETFGMGDVPDEESGLAPLLDPDPRLCHTDGGWTRDEG